MITILKLAYSSNLGGLDLSRQGLDRDSRSRHQKKVSLDGRENLDSFKKLVSTIEISQSRSRNLDFVLTAPSRSKYLDRDLPKISIISWSRSRSSYTFHKSRSRLLLLIHFTNRHLWKDVTFHSCLLVKNLSKMSRNLDKSR